MLTIYITINDISRVGGLSKVALNLYEAFTQRGFRVFIVTGHLGSRSLACGVVAKEDIIDLGLPSLHQIVSLRKRAWWFVLFCKRLKRLSFPSEAVFLSIETYINFATFCALGGKRLIATEHTSYRRKSYTQFLKRIVYKRVSALVVLTQKDKELYEKKMGLGNVTHIVNFASIPKKVSTLQEPNILFAGTLDTVKGADFLPEIIERFTEEGWRFLIAGEGKLAPYLRKRLPTKKSKMLGIVDAMDKLYLQTSIVILPSRKEGFSLVLLEAKSYGIPAVAFDCESGPREIVKEGEDGFLVQTGDIEAFVQKLHLLASSDTLRFQMGRKARLNVEAYSEKKVMKQWIELIESLSI